MNHPDEETPVSASRHERAGDLLLNALEQPPSERLRFLCDACADDTAMLAEVTSLLNAHGAADGFLTAPIIDAARAPLDETSRVLESPIPLAPGVTVDQKYRIDRMLGKGGMGEVYLATHLGTTRTVAVKVINPEYASVDEFIARFRREAAAAGRLRHPNIINVTDFGVADIAGIQLPYLVMEYLDGHTLGDYLKQHGRMPLDQVLDVVDQVALALDSAHAAGIVHRDLKPDNIWVESNRRGGYNVKVLDFGIAKTVSGEGEVHPGTVHSTPAFDSTAELQSDRTITICRVSNQPGETDLKTRLGAIVGTPAYMSPEQCLGMPVDYRADIYSLAVITYELVAGHPPFQGATVAELLSQQIEAPVPSPHKFDADISKPIAAAVMRGLEKNPADRPVSAGTLAALLRAVVEGEFSVLRKGKDTFQSYPSVFAPLWIAAFAPLLPLGVATLLVLSQVSKLKIVPDRWLVTGFYVAAVCLWFVCAQIFKAAAALMLLKVSSIGAFRPATSAVITHLISGLPDLLHTQFASLLDLRPASVWQNQLWPVAWALEDLRGKDALRRSQQLTRTVPDVALTLLPRFYAPPLCAALSLPALSAFFPGANLTRSVLAGGAASWWALFYLLFASRLYVLYGTAFPFYFYFARLCQGECNMPALPATGAGRERSDSAKRRSSTLIWWLIPAALVFVTLIGLVRKHPVDFVNAVAEGHGSEILRAIDGGQAVDTTTTDGESALYVAAQYGDVSLIKALLERGANIDRQQHEGKTALMEAVLHHHEAATRLLLSRGANVNLQNIAGRTALMAAAINGNVEIAAMLIEHSANVKLQDVSGKSALDLALEERHPEIVALLSR